MRSSPKSVTEGAVRGFTRGSRVVACLFGGILLVAGARAATVTGFEAWQQAEVSQRLDYGLTAMLEGENRILSSSPYWVYDEVVPQILWRYSPRYDFAAGFEWSSWRYAGSRMIGNQPFLDTTVKWSGGRWTASSRQRFQTGTEGGSYVAMFRQLSRLQYQLPGFNNRLSLYAADEWFLDFVAGGLTENRAFLGSAFMVNSSVVVELYGVLQTYSNDYGISGNLPGLGIKAVCAF